LTSFKQLRRVVTGRGKETLSLKISIVFSSNFILKDTQKFFAIKTISV